MSTIWDHDPETGEIIETGGANAGEYSVSEIANALKRTLEDAFGHVRVRGEISGYRGPSSSGHCYFSIKDEGAKLDAVIWRGSFNRLRSRMQEGLEVIATGKITSYAMKSAYQIVIESVEPAGAGALMALLEERKKKLAAEGLFDAARKRPIPYLPELIGVVTSPTGAVIRDILHRLNDRFPRHVMVWPVRVQGETCAAEVAAAIAGFNGMARKPDVIIVARGGGSLEDLWGFNEEIVVRAAAASAIPLISAIGHETDTTLIDYAADLRAPTPTAAAEKAVPVRADLVAEVARLDARMQGGLSRYMDERQTRVRSAARALPRPDELLALVRQRFDSASGRLLRALKANTREQTARLGRVAPRLTLAPMRTMIANERRSLELSGRRAARALSRLVAFQRQRFDGLAKLVGTLSYKSVLRRGFALVRDDKGKPVHAAADVKQWETLRLEFADGEVKVREDSPRQGQFL
ncbi:exodeoxyribonuclease VII large subunit [Aestuariivirga sp.]|uniref:exodeoxyribonuclease VII large subunit n=1 Tax=Aestuariivirga sp. TaxID=2650926 RepID=UPI0025BD3556|nr:exodeoxyribonuclease VII large subunit [Aestuariivirga sp.]MCA3555432.1 exodeoxyribonuclease VII large subunit [Aestuariivirga sp.]